MLTKFLHNPFYKICEAVRYINEMNFKTSDTIQTAIKTLCHWYVCKSVISGLTWRLYCSLCISLNRTKHVVLLLAQSLFNSLAWLSGIQFSILPGSLLLLSVILLLAHFKGNCCHKDIIVYYSVISPRFRQRRTVLTSILRFQWKQTSI